MRRSRTNSVWLIRRVSMKRRETQFILDSDVIMVMKIARRTARSRREWRWQCDMERLAEKKKESCLLKNRLLD